MDSLNHYAIAPLLTSLTTFLLAAFVYFENRKAKVNRIFALYWLSLAVWSLFQGFLFISQGPGDKAKALLYARLLHLGVIFIPTLFIHSVLTFLDEVEREKKILILAYSVSIFLLIILPTKLFIKDMVPKVSFRYIIDLGPLYLTCPLFFASYIIYGLYKLFKAYHVLSGIRANQIKYLFWGSAFGYLGGSCSFSTPFNLDIYPLNPYGVYTVPLYFFIVGYAIVKYHLMDIRLVISRTALGILAYSPVLAVPFYLGHKTNSWILSTTSAIVLVIPATLIYRHFNVRAENLIFKKQRQYQRILRESSEEIITLKDENVLLEKLSSLLSDNILSSFVACYLFHKEEYLLKISNPPLSLFPRKLEAGHALIEDIKEKRDALFDYVIGDTSIPLVLSIGKETLPSGFLFLGEKEDKSMYSGEDVETLKTLLNQVSLGLENIRHIKETIEEQKEKERLKKEMELARQIQTSLLPQEAPRVEGVSIEGLLLPAKEVAGDYYDFIVYSPQRVGVVLGDVSGKGLDSGMIMSMAKATLYTLSRGNLSPRNLVIDLNEILCAQIRQQKFISLIYAEYDSGDNTFTWSGAGHEHVIICRRTENGEVPLVEVIKTGGIVLGMLDNIDHMIEQNSVTLGPGDRIVLYTDGATEARNTDNDMFTLERLVNTVKSAPPLSHKEFLIHIKDQIQEFTQDAPQYDDITLVVLGRE